MLPVLQRFGLPAVLHHVLSDNSVLLVVHLLFFILAMCPPISSLLHVVAVMLFLCLSRFINLSLFFSLPVCIWFQTFWSSSYLAPCVIRQFCASNGPSTVHSDDVFSHFQFTSCCSCYAVSLFVSIHLSLSFFFSLPVCIWFQTFWSSSYLAPCVIRQFCASNGPSTVHSDDVFSHFQFTSCCSCYAVSLFVSIHLSLSFFSLPVCLYLVSKILVFQLSCTMFYLTILCF